MPKAEKIAEMLKKQTPLCLLQLQGNIIMFL